MDKTKSKKQIVNSIKDSLFHQIMRRLSDFQSYEDEFYHSPKDIIIWLKADEYEFLCREVLDV